MTGLEPPDVRGVLLDKQSEAAWQAQVLEWAKRGHWRVYHTHDSRRSPEGFPDLVLVHPGRHLLLFAELKRNTGRVSADQEAWLAALATVRRVEVGVWRPNYWEDVKAVLLRWQDVGRSD